MAKLTKRAIGLEAKFTRFLVRHDERGGGAIAGLRGIARRHRARGVEDRLQFRQSFERSIGARAFILIEDGFGVDGLAAGAVQGRRFHFHRHDFVVEMTLRLGFEGVLMAAVGEGVGILARDAVLALHLLGGEAHVDVDLRVVIDEPGIGRGFVAGHRDHAHGFAAARDEDVRAARANAVGRHGDRLQAGTAEAVDGDAGGSDGQAREQGGDARHIAAGFGFGHGAAEDDVFDVFFGDLRDIWRASARMTVAARSSGRVLRRAPRLAFPTGVRRQSTMTASGI